VLQLSPEKVNDDASARSVARFGVPNIASNPVIAVAFAGAAGKARAIAATIAPVVKRRCNTANLLYALRAEFQPSWRDQMRHSAVVADPDKLPELMHAACH
jgi:hypothetical protein